MPKFKVGDVVVIQDSPKIKGNYREYIGLTVEISKVMTNFADGPWYKFKNHGGLMCKESLLKFAEKDINLNETDILDLVR